MLYDLYLYCTNLPRWHIFGYFVAGYLVYYLIEVVKVRITVYSSFRTNFPNWCVRQLLEN
jgi:hypothetical protein